MRDLRVLELYRQRSPAIEQWLAGSDPAMAGIFSVHCAATGGTLFIVASNGDGWDHVSVSLHNRTPNWTEMEFIKRKFFHDGETAMQLHVPPADHINCHPFCLHLWRPHAGEIPRPPAIMVAPPNTEARHVRA